MAEAVGKVGEDGQVTVRETRIPGERRVEIVEGIHFNRGLQFNSFVGEDNELGGSGNAASVVAWRGKFDWNEPFEVILNDARSNNKPVILIADGFTDRSIEIMLANHQNLHRFRQLPPNQQDPSMRPPAIFPVRSPGTGDRRHELLTDIAVMTGGKVLGDKAAVSRDNNGNPVYETADAGECGAWRIEKSKTILEEPRGETDAITNRIDQIRAAIENAETDYEKERAQERMACMAGGVARVFIGAESDVERGELRDRVDDALHAATASLRGGVVPGCGKSMLVAIGAIEERMWVTHGTDATRAGALAFIRALRKPTEIVLRNSLPDKAHSLRWKLEGELGNDMTIDACTGEAVIAKDSGMIVPTMVETTAIRKAVSVATQFIKTCGIVVEAEA